MNWNDEPILYFHTVTRGGLAASLPMKRVLRAFGKRFAGIPGIRERLVDGVRNWIVPGYKCINCQKTFFVAEAKDLQHACTNDGGVISAKA